MPTILLHSLRRSETCHSFLSSFSSPIYYLGSFCSHHACTPFCTASDHSEAISLGSQHCLLTACFFILGGIGPKFLRCYKLIISLPLTVLCLPVSFCMCTSTFFVVLVRESYQDMVGWSLQRVTGPQAEVVLTPLAGILAENISSPLQQYLFYMVSPVPTGIIISPAPPLAEKWPVYNVINHFDLGLTVLLPLWSFTIYPKSSMSQITLQYYARTDAFPL